MQVTKPSLLVVSLTLVLLCHPAVSQSDADGQASSGLVEQRAEAGDAEAQDEMGSAADHAHHNVEAFKWFQLAAKQGLGKSQASLGYAYDMGLGVEQDRVQAVRWYALAAVQGYPEAEFNLAMCYHHGDGVEPNNAVQNRMMAIKWFSLAISHGYKAAANGLGLVYEFDLPAPDYAEAFRWYKKGAELGDEEAEYNTCRLTTQGLGTPADYSEALRWCSEAANSGSKTHSAWGEYGLARIYENGLGVPQDFEKAAEWCRKSAEEGNPDSQLRLADLYSTGKGVKRDLKEAYMWASVAGSLGNPDALDYLQTITPDMKESDVLTSQARAREWIKQHPRDTEDDPSINILYHK